MLDRKIRQQAKEFILQGYKNYTIGKKLDISANTVQRIREEVEKEHNQLLNIDSNTKKPTELTKKFIDDINYLLKSKKVTEEQEKFLKKFIHQLQELIKVEVDERIPAERADAVQKNDEEWREVIQENYVDKEVRDQLQNTIDEQKQTIADLQQSIREKDAQYEKDQKQIRNLEIRYDRDQNQIKNLIKENGALESEKNRLNTLMDNKFDTEIRQDLELLKQERVKFEAEKNRFHEFRKHSLSELTDQVAKINEKEKAVENRELEVAQREEKVQQARKELDDAKEQWNTQRSEVVSSINNEIKSNYNKNLNATMKKIAKESFASEYNEIQKQKKELRELIKLLPNNMKISENQVKITEPKRQNSTSK